MAEARRLTRFSIEATEGGYRLIVEDDHGQAMEVVADDDQIDMIIDELDDVLAGPPIEDGD